MSAAALLLLATVTIAAQQQQAPPAPVDGVRLYGRVVTENGGPVRGASVAVSDAQGKAWSHSTDEHGVFEVRGLPPGAYRVVIKKAGFLDNTAARAVINPRTNDGHNGGDYLLRRAGAIAGRVVDGLGEPVVGAVVSATRTTYMPPGTRYNMLVTSVPTNDLGEYRLFGLQPGTYYVAASNQSMDQVLRRLETGLTIVGSGSGSVPTFYPSTLVESEAQPIRLGAGEQRLGTDIALQLATFSRITGRIVDSNGQPAARASIMLTTAHDGRTKKVGESDGAGVFSLVEVPPGQYILRAMARGYLEAVGREGSAQVRKAFESAATPVTVVGDVSGLFILMSRGFDVRGRITVDGAPPPPGWGGQSVFLFASPQSHEAGPGSRAQPVDGAFILAGVPAGRAKIFATNLTRGAMVARVMLNGFDVTDDGFDVNNALTGIEVAITTNPAVVTGVVTDAKGDRVSAGIIVFSENSRFWTMPDTRYLSATTNDPSGAYRLPSLPAGRYLVVAVTDFDPMTWADPDNLAELRKVATLLTLPETGTVTLNLVRR